MSTQGALLSSSSSSRRWKNDVFLSFRGMDTRHSFADHLYEAMRMKGILIVTGDEEFNEFSISPGHSKLIEESQLAIVIFSKNYAYSKLCLDELEKIVQCKSKNGMYVLPIFYHVNPGDIRKQTGPLEPAFAEHEKRYKENMEMVKSWRSALSEVGNVSGLSVRDG